MAGIGLGLSKENYRLLGDYLHARYPALRTIPKGDLVKPFFLMIGLVDEVQKKTDQKKMTFEDQVRIDATLLSCIEKNDAQGVRQALDQGADPNAKIGKNGRSNFIIAVRSADIGIIQLLIDRGANVNDTDNSGNTPLIHATSKIRLDVIELLLSKGADPYVKNRSGKNALDIAKKSELEKTSQLFMNQMRQELRDKDKHPTIEEKEELNEQLMIAAKGNDLESALSALEKGADPNARDKGPQSYGRTPLMWAAEHDHAEIAKILIESNADKDARDSLENTALIIAAKANSLNVARMLLANKADVNARTKTGENAIIWAVTRKHSEMMDLLLSYGAVELEGPTLFDDFKKKSEEQVRILNDTLIEKAGNSDWNSVREVLLQGADPNTKDNEGWSLLSFAACAGNIEIAKMALEKGVDVNSRDNAGRTPLMHAARAGQYDMVVFLLNRGGNPDLESTYSETALSFADKKKHYAIEALLKSLKERKEEPQRPTTKRMPVMLELPKAPSGVITQKIQPMLEPNLPVNQLNDTLIQASRASDLDGVMRSVATGADVNSQDRNGMTALMSACAAGDLGIVLFLMEKKASLNLKNNDGMTALMLASGNGHKEVVDSLISGGANIKEKNNSGKTALDLAATYKNNGEISRIIRKAEEKMHLDGFLLPAIAMNYSDSVRDLLDRGADPNIKDGTGRTPLIVAVTDSNEGVMDLLLSRGAEVETKDNNGWTPLKHAAAGGFVKIAEKLISKGAKIDAVDNFGRTPLMEAAYYGQMDVVKLLISNSVDTRLKDKTGKTALDYAVLKGHQGIAKLLEKCDF